MKPKTIAILTAAVLLLIILLQNTQIVSIQFLFWELGMSRIIFLPLVMAIGFIIGYVVGRMSRKS